MKIKKMPVNEKRLLSHHWDNVGWNCLLSKYVKWGIQDSLSHFEGIIFTGNDDFPSFTGET
jgi:hypothetical protein